MLILWGGMYVQCGPLRVCSYERLRLVGRLVICKMDLVR